MLNPTPAELEILHILWRLGEVTVAEVNTEINKTKKVGYTTTLKTMQIMHSKKLLGRNKQGKSHSYFPIQEEQATKSSLVKRLVTSVFGGSNSKLILQLIGGKEISKQEIDEIRQYLDTLENKDKNDD